MSPAVAIVGMACRYPDARSPAELWENVLARRRAFRRIPPERLRIEDYLPRRPGDPDSAYAVRAALIEGWDFDRVRFHVSARALRSADLAHWLALEVAADAIADAGFLDGEGLPRDLTGVVVGNTLTGERSRADALRLRFPYVRRVALATLEAAGLPPEERAAIVGALEERFKAPLAPPDEDTLAGGLSNTIAGRICNHFDLHGGGYTVDGACASSLLAVTTACTALAAGDLDVAIAGGVDVSLDPFELVGFSRAGALAAEVMRVYDARPTGFLPGEGAGFVVLMRHEDAIAGGRRVYAAIRGWGVSSDGSGGLTRPEAAGQLLALRRAYARAGFGAGTVGYFEGHGTGTAVGDAAELAALSAARREGGPASRPAAVGSIKANLGHTKAAAGMAGLLKATLALSAQILPPATGCETPHAELTGSAPALRVLSEPEPWPADLPLRAGVSAMGFGGINTHVALEGAAPARRTALTARERDLAVTQDVEVFLLGAPSLALLRQEVDRLATIARGISLSELGDAAAALARAVGRPPVRAAVVASSPDDLVTRLEMLSGWLAAGRDGGFDAAQGVFLGVPRGAPRVGFLFPGQGAPSGRGGGALARRFAWIERLYADHPLPDATDPTSTAFAQPAIALASVAALSLLGRLGIAAGVAVGHSFGEVVALHWAGAMDDETLLRVARARGAVFAEHGLAGGAMAALRASAAEVEPLLRGTGVVVAGLNAPDQTVVSGAAHEVAAVVERARAQGSPAVPLRVSHAFHSPLVAPAAQALAACLEGERFGGLARRVVSTVTGAELDPGCDLRAHLSAQVTRPVRFEEALRAAASKVDLLVEVGPGRALSALAAGIAGAPAISVDAGGPSLAGLLHALGAAFVLGAPVDAGALFAGRLVRPFDLDRPRRFIENPCESAPIGQSAPPVEPEAPATPTPPAPTGEPPLEVVMRLLCERTDLPRSALRPDARLLGDLHLGSIAVGQIVVEAGKRLGLSPSRAPTEYADATIAELSRALEEAGKAAPDAAEPAAPPGVDTWVRPFVVDWIDRPRPPMVPLEPRRGGFSVLAQGGDALGAALHEALGGGDEGVLVCVPAALDRAAIDLLLEGARRCREPRARRFVLAHRGAGAAFARTLHLEMPHVATVVVEVPDGDPRAAAWVAAEAASTAEGFREVRYDAGGRRSAPVLRLLPDTDAPGALPVGRGDVILVTGGGKGISAECAFHLARETGARLLLLGRSSPGADRALAGNIERFAAAGVTARYVSADVTDAGAVRAAVREGAAALGPVTGILHGAGTNTPALLGSLGAEAFLRTLAVKVGGLDNALAAVDPGLLRVLVAFGSIIGRAGMRGEADYAVANEELRRAVERFGRAHPACRCLAVEWSVWSGVGMGERLGTLEALLRRGITPIPPEEGTAMLRRLLSAREVPAAVVVAGRLGETPTLALDRPELPLGRFLEHPSVHVPGVELIAESELSADADPYLADHVVSGEALFPGVMGLEAMAQVASALVGTPAPLVFEHVRFARPVAVPGGGRLRVRVAALARTHDRVDVVLRSEATGFAVNHFEATCRFGVLPDDGGPAVIEACDGRVALDPGEELYGTVLFHGGRFRRLAGYRRLLARACVAEIAPGGDGAWFGRFLPGGLLLGDPAARDAALHAVQACVPHATLLPVAVERITFARSASGPAALVHARERRQEGDTFVYDLEIADARGALVERWTGLTLRIARGDPFRGPWPEALLGPYLERRVRELLPGAELSIAVHRDPVTPRPARSDRAVALALTEPAAVRRRPDGRPELAGSPHTCVSIAHAGDLSLAVVGEARVGCDVEAIVARPPSVWRELLGSDRFRLAELVAAEAREDLDAAATRLWTLREALKKAGAPPDAPIVLAAVGGDGWALFSSGALSIASAVLSARRAAHPLAFAVLVEVRRAGV